MLPSATSENQEEKDRVVSAFRFANGVCAAVGEFFKDLSDSRDETLRSHPLIIELYRKIDEIEF